VRHTPDGSASKLSKPCFGVTLINRQLATPGNTLASGEKGAFWCKFAEPLNDIFVLSQLHARAWPKADTVQPGSTSTTAVA
jgi:hypothetical protein